MLVNSMISKIMDELNDIQYGYLDTDGSNIINDEDRWEKEFYLFYHLQSPEELLKTKCGVCWDQVELERELFSKTNYKFYTYFIYIEDDDMLPSHTFLVYEDNSKYYWFEHSWGVLRGIHEYLSLEELFKDVSVKFIESHSEVVVDNNLFIYEYSKPEYGINCDGFYDFIFSQRKVDIDFN